MKDSESKNKNAAYWTRSEERGILPEAVNQVLSDQWNRFKVDPVKYIDSQHCLEYTEPQADWVNGTPMGNGDMGCMAYGSPEAMMFHFAKTDLWDYRPFEKPNFPKCSFDELRKTIISGDKERFDDISRSRTLKGYHAASTVKPGGTFRIEAFPNSKLASFNQRLSYANAETTQSWTPYGIGVDEEFNQIRDNVQMNSFIHAAQNVFVCNIQPGEKLGWHSPLRWSFYRYEDPKMEPPEYHIEDNCFWLRQELPGGEHFIMMGTCDSPDFKICDCFGRIEGHGTPTSRDLNFYITIVTSKDAKDPLAKAKQNIESALEAGYGTLHEAHLDWWHKYWKRAYICTPWKELEWGWYYSLYLTAAICRPGRLSPGLQGNFIKENYPAWNADFHNNINMQVLNWGQDTANRLEFAEPLYKLLWDVLPKCKENTADYFKMRGARYPISMGTDGVETAPGILLSTWIGAGGWFGQHYWWHYKYSGDKAFLEKYAYPFVKEAVTFYEDYLQENEDGSLYLFPTIHMEYLCGDIEGAGRNSCWDLPFVTRAFQIALAAAQELDIDPDDCKRWKDILSRMADVPVSETDIDVWKEFSDKPGPQRLWNWVRLNPIFPCELVGQDSGPDKLRQQALATAEDFLSNESNEPTRQTFSGMVAATALARMGKAEGAMMIAEDVCKNVSPSGFIATKGSHFVQVDASPGFSVMMNEMLLQSYDGILRIFPATPECDEPVRFHSLRAQGGFLVSAERRGKLTQYVVVQSLCGNKLVIRNPFENEFSTGVQVKVYKLDADTQMNTVEQQQAVRTYKDRIYMPGEMIELDTEKGQVYLISKEIPYITNVPVETL